VNAPAGFDVLATIVAAATRRVASAKAREPLDALERRAARRAPRAAFFRAALTAGGVDGLRVIAECKRRSPSRGILRASYDPVAIARAYAAAGAVALSVLTEPAFFDGSLADLTGVVDAVPLPVLRKDFVVDRYQLAEARAAGADAVLLIAAALEDTALALLIREADGLGLAALVEVHDAQELRRAVGAGATIIGVNNRNLRSLGVDLSTSSALAGSLPADCVAVSESGLRTHADLRRLQADGFDAFLIGERCMTADDPGAALAQLLGRAAEARPS
jgi:indole-3-glycerol phosphate synthase